MSNKSDPLRALKMSLGLTGSRDIKFMFFLVPVFLAALFASRYVDDQMYPRLKNDEEFMENRWKKYDQQQLQKIRKEKTDSN